MPEKAQRKFGKKEPHPSNVLRLVKALLLLAKKGLTLEDFQLEAAVKVASSSQHMTLTRKPPNKCTSPSVPQIEHHCMVVHHFPRQLHQLGLEASATVLPSSLGLLTYCQKVHNGFYKPPKFSAHQRR